MSGKLSSIASVAAVYGISLRTLRFYEQVGLIAPLREGTVRLYSAKDLIKLELILKGRRLGFSLSEIKRLIDFTPTEDHAESAKDEFVRFLSPNEIVRQLHDLETKRADICDAINELRGKLA